jgi:ribonucleoside-diphosphate reductase alpha chain
MSTSNTIRDLELKRYALMSTAERPRLDWGSEIARTLTMDKEIRLVGGQGERDFQVGMVGDIVGDAMAAVLLAQGQDDLDTVENRKFAGRIARDVVDRLGTLGGDRLTISEYDLSVLIEAVLIEAGAFDIAKSLVSQRSRLPKSETPTSVIKMIRRNNQVVPWNLDKIEIAVRKSFLSQGLNSEPAVEIAEAVGEKVRNAGNAYVGIETVQDLVQEELMRRGHFKVAEGYITYRAQRAMMRLSEKSSPANDQFEMISVLDEAGNSIFWDGEDLRRRIDFALIGLNIAHLDARGHGPFPARGERPRGLGDPYDSTTLYKGRRFCSSTPTLFNSGTPHSQLSSCYLYKVDDSIESIMFRGIAENAFLSKWAGGLGGSGRRCAAPAATSTARTARARA